MQKRNTKLKGLALMTSLLICQTSWAHMVWLERDGNGAGRVYFGEYAENVREKSGGALDRIATPVLFTEAPDKPLALQRKADHIEVANAVGDLRLINAVAPREDKKNGGNSRTVFLARAGRSTTTAALDLELVPVAANGNRFTLFFKGQPLAKTELTLIGPPLWQKPLQTDELGQFTIETPWAGRYLIETAHTVEAAGEVAGAKFDRTRYVFTLSFVLDKGISWSPAP